MMMKIITPHDDNDDNDDDDVNYNDNVTILNRPSITALTLIV